MRRHHNPFTPDPDIWGSGEVPAYRQLTNVRRFESAFVMVDPVGSTELMEVGFKKSAQEFELQKDDVVILRGRKGNFYALPHPFVIPPQATDPDNHCMELFALCRKGQSVYLRDVSNLARPDVDYLHDWLRMITERQQRLARHHRGFGRTMLHAFPLFGLPFLTAYLVQENGPGDLLQRQGAGVGSGVALGVLLTYFNHRRQHPRQLSTGRNAGTRP